jgi:PAS domain S-box-containing protein
MRAASGPVWLGVLSLGCGAGAARSHDGRPVGETERWIVPDHRIGSRGFRLPLSLFILLALAPCAGGGQAPPPDALGTKNILVLNSHETNMPVFVGTERGLSTTLQSGGMPSLNQFFESLDLRRNPGPEHRKLLVEGIRERYSHRKLDMIIAVYPEALEFVLGDCRDILPDVPILAVALPVGFELPKTDRRIIANFVRIDIIGTLELALKLIPGAKRVYVVSGAHKVDRIVEAQARRDLKPWETRLEFIYLSHMPFEEMLATVSHVPPDSILLALAFSQDVTGKSNTSPIAIQRLSRVSPAPIFGILDYVLGYGIVGGSLINFERIGVQAGLLALNILRGTQGSENLPAILDVPPVPMFDGRQLKHWNLSVDAVPLGSAVINREYTLWERYRTEVIVAFFVLVVQALLIVSFVVSRAQRQSAERQLAQQLRAETFLAELSTRFIRLPASQIESEIQDAQRQICEIFDLDRSTLWQDLENAPGTLWLTHIHTPAGTAPAPDRMDMREFSPWALQALVRRETLALSTLAALPPEAARDRETLQRYGTKSVVVIPLFAEGTVFGALTFAAMRAEREWQEESVKRFQMVAQVVANALARKRAEESLESRLRFESLLSELSARFVNVRSDQIDSTIADAQRRVCELLGLDIAALWQWSGVAPGVLTATHVYAREGLQAPEEMRQEQFPWYRQQMLAGRMVAFSSLEELPAEAAVDRESCRLFGVKSNLCLPLSVGGEPPVGALGFNTLRAERDWPDAAVKRLQLVAQVFTNALVRKRSEEALRESEARLTLAAASADARLWEIEVDTGQMWMTEEGRRFFGFAPDKVLTLDDLAGFIHPDDREPWRQNIRQALETAQPMRSEFRVVGADGNVRWISSQGRFHGGAAEKPRRLLGVSIDVTERKRAEERLRTSEALSTGVLASLPGYMVIVDRSGNMLRTSDTWKEFAAGDGALDPSVLAIGMSQHQASQRAVEEIGPGVREIQGGIEAVLSGTQADFRLDYAYPTRTEERWASVSVLPLQRTEGGAVIYHQDITLQQRSRLEVEQLRRDLTHVSRVTTMGEVAAALAHELNQPLTAIMSNAHAGERYLAQAVPPLDEIREILHDVMGDARRAGEVIQRLRSLLRKEEARFLPLDVNHVIREIAALVHTDAVLRNLEIDLDLAPDLPSVRGDRIQLQQVLLNLVLNGMEAIGSDGEGRHIALQTLQVEGAVRISVRDQGPGIPEDTLSRIFETFYTTKQDGMGMGLAISRSIVEAHGGRIWAENNPDRGATFSFTLPACPPGPTTA